MKSITNRKRNSTTSRISGNNSKDVLRLFINSGIFDVINDTINGVSIAELEDRMLKQQVLPPGVRAACHRHDKTLYFDSIDELTKHNQERHDYRKGG